MKEKLSLVFMVLMLAALHGISQISGQKSIPGDYSDIATAISALNTSGVGTGGVFFNVAAGHTETFPALTSGLITATGTATDSVVFRKSGTGSNPKIIAATPGAGNYDYIVCIGGGDYITFDGIDVEDNPANTTATTRMEFGFALYKASETDGAQHNTLKNGTISLSFNTNAYGIILDHRRFDNPAGGTIAVSAVSGTNSWNDFSNLTFNNCYGGINLKGFNAATPFIFYDQNNSIGVNGGNIFSYTGLAGTSVFSYGINAIYQDGLVIANNTFSGSLSMTTGRYYAMNLLDSDNADLDIFNNTLTIDFTGSGHFYGFYVNGMGRNGTDNTVNFYNNHVINNTFATHTNGNVVYAYVTTGSVHTNCYSNTVSNNAIGSSTANSTGLVYYLWCRSDPTNKAGAINYHDNTISGNTRSSAAATVTSITYFLYNTGSSDTLNIYNNVIDNNTAYTNKATGITIAHIGKSKNIFNNTITNISGIMANITGIFNANGAATTVFYRNRIENLRTEGNPSIVVPTICSALGIQQSTGTNTYYYNNYISQLYAPISQSISAVIGIQVSGAGTLLTGLYFNTVYLDGTSSNPGFGSRAVFAEIGANLDLRNNLFVNSSIPTAGGQSIAYYRSGADLSTYLAESDNNDFYAGDPGPDNLIFSDGTNSLQSLADYQAFVAPRDGHSISVIPPFINAAFKPYDLHLQVNANTLCESGATVVSTPYSVISDFDGNPRYPNPGYPNNPNPAYAATAPDIGADEFGGIRSYVPFSGLTGTVTNAVCPTSSEGAIDLTETGGTPPFTYLWSNSSTTQDLTGLVPGIYSVTVADNTGAQVTGSWSVGVDGPICNHILVMGTPSDTGCYNAYQTITVAGGVSTFVVANGKSAELIAGQAIHLFPGTVVMHGGYFLAHITQDSTFCGNNPAARPILPGPGLSSGNVISESFRVWPNPTKEKITLECLNETFLEGWSAVLVDFQGRLVHEIPVGYGRIAEFRLEQYPAGLYLVRLSAGSRVQTYRVIKH